MKFRFTLRFEADSDFTISHEWDNKFEITDKQGNSFICPYDGLLDLVNNTIADKSYSVIQKDNGFSIVMETDTDTKIKI